MRKIVITGCSSGFGLEFLNHLLQSSDSNPIWILGTTRNLARVPSNIIVEKGHRVDWIVLDHTIEEDRKGLKRWIEQNWNGKIDVLINNAGYGVYGSIEDLSETQVREQIEVCFLGPIFLTRELLPLLRNSQGHAVMVGSTLGFVGFPLSGAYAAAKHALEGATESLAFEVPDVSFTLMEPGSFPTQFSNNLKWGERSHEPESPYYKLTQSYLKFRQWKAKQKPKSCKAVLRGLDHALRCRPMRVRCGNDANLVYWIRKILPAQYSYRVFRWAFQKLFDRVASR